MSLQLNTPPAAEPVTLAEAKAWLRVDTGDDDDALITSLISAARARAEWHTGRAFVTQGWTLWLDCWPSGACAEIPLPPLQGVQSSVTTLCARRQRGGSRWRGRTIASMPRPSRGRVLLKQCTVRWRICAPDQRGGDRLHRRLVRRRGKRRCARRQSSRRSWQIVAALCTRIAATTPCAHAGCGAGAAGAVPGGEAVSVGALWDTRASLQAG